jgi:catechol 2,3-dioxygenase-like lactoylglutathione lyase family enzyme
MRTTSYYPVIMTADVKTTAAFYQRHFRFAPLFSAYWYVRLQSTEDDKVTLAVLDGSHDTIPAPHRGRASGLLLNFEVDDVDEVYGRLKQAGLPILLDIRVRHAV